MKYQQVTTELSNRSDAPTMMSVEWLSAVFDNELEVTDLKFCGFYNSNYERRWQMYCLISDGLSVLSRDANLNFKSFNEKNIKATNKLSKLCDYITYDDKASNTEKTLRYKKCLYLFLILCITKKILNKTL